jgi:hypothetical protein
MAKGFAKPPKKYPPNGRWFCSYNWENGFYGTLDECLDRIEHCFSADEFLGTDLLLFSLQQKADPDNPALQDALGIIESKIQEDENQCVAKVRRQVRDKCLREGSAEGGSNSNYWNICFKGKGV